MSPLSLRKIIYRARNIDDGIDGRQAFSTIKKNYNSLDKHSNRTISLVDIKIYYSNIFVKI